MFLETQRLLLREWRESDASNLYELAKDPKIGPIAGWPIHTSVENSLDIIRNVLAKEYSYAVFLKSENKVVGSIGLMIGENSNLEIRADEGEIGYWIGFPYWGKGLIPEAVNELIRYSFEELNINKLWCGYFEGNNNSKRVQEKCGFVYSHTNENIYWPIMDDYRTEHITSFRREDWKKTKE